MEQAESRYSNRKDWHSETAECSSEALEQRTSIYQEELQQALSSLHASNPENANAMRDTAADLLTLEKNPEQYIAARDAALVVRELNEKSLNNGERPYYHLLKNVLYPSLANSAHGRKFLADELRTQIRTPKNLPIKADADSAMEIARLLGQTDSGSRLLLEVVRHSHHLFADRLLLAGLQDKPEFIQELRERKQSSSCSFEFRAALARLGCSESLRELEEAIRSEEFQPESVYFAIGLADEGQEILARFIAESLSQERSPWARHSMLYAMHNLAAQTLSSETEQVLITVLERDASSELRALSAKLLTGSTAAEASLTKLFQNPTAGTLRRDYALALRGTQNKEARAALLKEVVNGGSARYQAAIALGVRQETQDLLIETVTRNPERDPKLQPLAAKLLASHRGDEAFQKAIFKALGHAKLKGQITLLIRALSSSDVSIKLAEELIENKEHSGLTRFAAAATLLSRGEQGRKAVAKVFSTLSFAEQRDALYLLVSVNQSAEAAALAAKCVRSNQSDLRRTAVHILAQQGGYEAELKDCLSDYAEVIRIAAAAGLRDDEEASSLLAEAALDGWEGEASLALKSRPNAASIVRRALQTGGASQC